MKFSGIVGFKVGENEVCPGVWKPEIVERPYLGDVLRNTRRNQQTDKQNTDLTINNQISMPSDLYMQQNWNNVCYVIWNGVKWSVSSVEINYPRITFDLGGVYNENEG